MSRDALPAAMEMNVRTSQPPFGQLYVAIVVARSRHCVFGRGGIVFFGLLPDAQYFEYAGENAIMVKRIGMRHHGQFKRPHVATAVQSRRIPKAAQALRI